MPEREDRVEARNYTGLRRQIKGVLRRYFECDDSGSPNKEYDETYSAQDAIDEIHKIVGDI